MKSLSFLVPLTLLSMVHPGALRAATYEVGLGQQFVTIASVPTLKPGDLVNIHCGVYHEVRSWTANGTAANPIILRGVCATGRPLIDASGKDLSGNGSIPRAAWQIEGAYYLIDNLEFKNARNGESAAGIRVMNAGTTINNCKITYSDNGIMSSTLNADNMLVQNTEIAYNGTGILDGQTHNVYLTKGGTITFAYCYIHHAISGENFKSRAHYTQLFYNYISDSVESEVEGLDEGDTVGANSNMTMIGNILVSTPNRTVNTTKFIHFGQDMGGTHNGTLYLINNTLIAGSPSIGFLRSSASNSSLIAVNNIFYGSDTIVQPGKANNITGTNNWMPKTAAIPLGFTGTVTGALPGFANTSQRDFHLTTASQARDIGVAAPVYLNGSGAAQSGVPVKEYVHPLSSTARLSDGKLDAGAYEIAGTGSVVSSSPAGQSLIVDNTACTSPCTFQWSPGTSHTISAATQPGASGTRYFFNAWSDGGAGSHLVTAAATGSTFIASFTVQYYLTTAANPGTGGIINPPSGWFNAGSAVSIAASAGTGYQFVAFSGGLSGTTPQSLTVNAPANITANFALIASTSSTTSWYSAGGTWNYRKAVTISRTQVSGSSPLVNFPVLVSLADSNLQTGARADGNDLLFTAADGVTRLNYEIESYTSAGGQLQAWVSIPSLSTAADTTIYLYFGNPSGASQQVPAAVWDSNYRGVWHLRSGTTVSAADSTGNSAPGTIKGVTASAGKIAGAANNASDSRSITLTAANPGATVTVEAWVRPSGGSGNYQAIVSHDRKNGLFYRGGSGKLDWYAGGSHLSTRSLSAGAWNHVVVTADSANHYTFYINGVLDSTGTSAAMNNQLAYFFNDDAGECLLGMIDEVRVSNTLRSAAWIATEFNNQNTPAAFLAVGVQQIHP